MAHSDPIPVTSTDLPTARRLDWVEPIKGIAILGVVLYHIVLLLYGVPPFDHIKETWLPLSERLAQLAPLPNDSVIAALLTNVMRYTGWLGYQGVGLFLVLSGFGLTWSMMQRPPGSELNLGDYFARRVGRILPVYWAGHLFFVGFRAVFGQPDISVWDWRFYLSLAGGRFLPETFYYASPAWWYVGLVLQLYVIFPALWLWLSRTTLARFLLGTAALTLLSRVAALALFTRELEMWSMGALCVTRLFEFTLGMGLAHGLARQPQRLYRWLNARRTFGAAIGVYVFALAASFTREGQIVAHGLIAASLLVITYTLVRAFAHAPVLNTLLGWLGRQSYPLMILHQPILWWFIPLALTWTASYLLFWILLAGFAVVVVIGSAALGAAVERISAQAARRWRAS
jgi:peptidoglycan/LPS O-acetylase OafA/YrhL